MKAIDEIGHQLRALVATRLGAPATRISDAASLATDLDADSLDLVSLIMEIEHQFDIDIPDEDAMQLSTVKQLVDYVEFATAAKDSGRRRQIERPVRAVTTRR